MAESQKEKLMRILECSEAEAEDIIATDKIIQKGGRTPYDLDPANEKEALKFANVKEKTKKAPTVYNFKKEVNRKENVTKATIIAELVKFLGENDELSIENLEIINKERHLYFKCGENFYDLTLIQKRTPKK